MLPRLLCGALDVDGVARRGEEKVGAAVVAVVATIRAQPTELVEVKVRAARDLFEKCELCGGM